VSEDAAITHKVKEALGADENTAGVEVRIKTVGGVVFLDGEVDDEATQDAIEQIARKAEGVRLVMNRTQVRAPEHHPGRHERREPTV
jgi:osmotically-inducible protein OsmY